MGRHLALKRIYDNKYGLKKTKERNTIRKKKYCKKKTYKRKQWCKKPDALCCSGLALRARAVLKCCLYRAALLVQRYLLYTASLFLCVVRRVKEHHKVLHDSPLLKKTCVRQVVLDKWFPLSTAATL